MISTDMLGRLRTLLDEVISGYWTDDECYAALTDGQKEYAFIILAQYKARLIQNPDDPIPDILRVLYKKIALATSSSTIALSNDFWYDISFSLGGSYNRPLLRRDLSKNTPFDKANTYSGAQGYYYSIINNAVTFEVSNPVGLDYTFEYLSLVTAITSVINPILPAYTHEGIVVYAYAQLLKKSGRFQEASIQLAEFLQSKIKYL